MGLILQPVFYTLGFLRLKKAFIALLGLKRRCSLAVYNLYVNLNTLLSLPDSLLCTCIIFSVVTFPRMMVDS